MNNQPTTTLVLGGTRSGKTAWAEAAAIDIVSSSPAGSGAAKPFYLATGQASDDEMKARIERHRHLRAGRFTTIEAPVEIVPVIAERKSGEVLLVDSVGTWITNLMLASAETETAFAEMLDAVAACPGSCVFVSEEPGHGVVPDNAMARAFVDHVGELNQRLAALADRVVMVVAGIPTALKEHSSR